MSDYIAAILQFLGIRHRQAVLRCTAACLREARQIADNAANFVITEDISALCRLAIP